MNIGGLDVVAVDANTGQPAWVESKRGCGFELVARFKEGEPGVGGCGCE